MSRTSSGHPSDEFKRNVATEAYRHTPPGGYPEVAAKYGIEPKLVFDWVHEFFSPPPAPFSSMHVWIGTTTKSLEDFNQYFARGDGRSGDDLGDRNSLHAGATRCGFCIDLDRTHFYDEDLIYRQYFSSPIPVSQVVDELPLNTASSGANILEACEKRAISSANAVITYADPEQTIRDPEKLYNGLVYLGLFKDCVP